VARINDRRIEAFAAMDILEDNFPQEAVFPFDISTFYKYFDYSGLVHPDTPLDDTVTDRFSWTPRHIQGFFDNTDPVKLSHTERTVFSALVSYPELSDRKIAHILPYSRHTVSGLRRQFEEKGLIINAYVPDLAKLGLRIIEHIHARAVPGKPFDQEIVKKVFCSDPHTFLLVSRPYELIVLSTFESYEDASVHTAEQVRELKEQGYLFLIPTHHSYTVENMIIIKDIDMAPIIRKVLGISHDGSVME
jgi:hypothetical protein